MKIDYQNIWKEKELKVLHKFYQSAPQTQLEKMLPDRSWNAIQKKARQFGFSKNKAGEDIWSDKELAILIDAWSTNKPREYIEKTLLNRSWNAIRLKAGSLNLKNLKYERPIIPGGIVKADISIKGKEFKFGIVSDTHLGSRFSQISYLHQFYKLCEKEEIETILHAGDLSEGNGKLYPGQLFEMHIHGADNLKNFIVKNYPKFKGKTRVISGSHDLTLWKYEGYDLLKRVAEEREDIEYLGMESATWELGNKKFMLVHPGGGSAYALSWKLQKIIESFSSETKPHILITGHFHRAEYIPVLRNIFAFQAGNFQASTPFATRKNLQWQYGGWLVSMGIKGDSITNMKAEFIPFFKPIIDDYRNYE